MDRNGQSPGHGDKMMKTAAANESRRHKVLRIFRYQCGKYFLSDVPTIFSDTLYQMRQNVKEASGRAKVNLFHDSVGSGASIGK
jgi:hypothetical protein